MQSIRKIFKIGFGPSSSHTMGPGNAARIFKERNPKASSYIVELYGSLAATGKGHMTDVAIAEVLAPKSVEIVWIPEIELPFHPNGMILKSLSANKDILDTWTIYSIGGGDLADEKTKISVQSIYDKHSMKQILEWTHKTGKTFWEYVEETEGPEIFNYLAEVWSVMKAAIKHGIEEEGVLPGGLGLQRKASSYYVKAKGYNGSMMSRALLFAYALATSETNASGGRVVTAPTCGSCGVLPAVLYHLHTGHHNVSDKKIIRALATAGLIGNIVKENASVSGAEVGCQGEIGVACAMAAAAGAQLFGGTTSQIEYAAEMGLEHHLGLTCDPICGLVQVPCIERNAFAAVRALDSCSYAMLSDGKHLVSFDKVVRTMKETGHDLPSLYKETSHGGLAKNVEGED
ncbi:L-serine ammonia-lyase [Dysgonomonas macrotermitis]|uniref:L-serine dehydratase n=1 Tax=Dysgonomonas macrotermitis TaxID=1346286 RepID=A0A1M5G4H7_9BACT|nr:L-serine ammonia-lyase [Dysgonomonas macrotermitis]SHF98626.1 L-serine dehydratase [Dysgonomonas macrotermitis]